MLDYRAQIKAFYNNVRAGYYATVSLAIEKGIKTDIPRGDSKYALYAAADGRNLTIVSLLIDKSNNKLDIDNYAG